MWYMQCCGSASFRCRSVSGCEIYILMLIQIKIMKLPQVLKFLK
jgi:hypothetical protein